MEIRGTIAFLLGLGSSGKTETLKSFFGRNRGRSPWVKRINGVPVLCVRDASPQEELGKNGNVGDIITNIKKRIDRCKEYCRSNRDGRFILIIPMTIRQTGNRVTNENMVVGPIKWTEYRYDIFPLYLQKLRWGVEELTEKIRCKTTIRSVEDYNRQGGNLEEFIKLVAI